MTKSIGSLVATCPDCGGILQPVALERLTSAEVALGDPAPTLHLQCLLCGYEEDRADDETVLPA
jgi:hypothetical protein